VTESFGTARDVTAERATEGLPTESRRAIADQAFFGSFCARRSDDTEAIWREAPDTAWPGLDPGVFYTFVTLDP